MTRLKRFGISLRGLNLRCCEVRQIGEGEFVGRRRTEEETERNKALFGLFPVGNHRRSFSSPEDSLQNPASLAWIAVPKGERLFVFPCSPTAAGEEGGSRP
ncbi:hypothetical protein MRB53_032037 [Persea americana]|uniref:Uncharacterized protein n=1 Tax=Persea americana TaxID=3435 RepID=A0ACC2KR06_PERAE|nr:hypothetical protein MRB53_032037 [Persea americana]